ncbi:hypothetical protein A0H81_06769 [Grifola frondosa]|uniref:Uncharacterized protein n=1 Tax=Grifola frondosa TaxID=5627 RepID=A0A1C7MAD5_GRIFR|nr:hypothetical protein A0H81_06769 [Grifola frondosa]
MSMCDFLYKDPLLPDKSAFALNFTTLTSTFASTIGTRSEYLIRDLKARQGSTIDPGEFPAACQSACNSTITAASNCSTVACLCTSEFNTGLFNCLECLLSLDPVPSLQIQEQDTFNQYADACTSAGLSFQSQSITIPPATTGTVATSASSLITTQVSVTSSETLATPTGTTSGTSNTAATPAGTTTSTANTAANAPGTTANTSGITASTPSTSSGAATTGDAATKNAANDVHYHCWKIYFVLQYNLIRVVHRGP